jgi:hypothetical protein
MNDGDCWLTPEIITGPLNRVSTPVHCSLIDCILIHIQYISRNRARVHRLLGRGESKLSNRDSKTVAVLSYPTLISQFKAQNRSYPRLLHFISRPPGTGTSAVQTPFTHTNQEQHGNYGPNWGCVSSVLTLSASIHSTIHSDFKEEPARQLPHPAWHNDPLSPAHI